MRRGLRYQTMPRPVEAMEHTGSEALAQMIEWVDELRLRGLVESRIALARLTDDGRPTGRLDLGPGAGALITEGGHLVFKPNPWGGPGKLEVVDAERFYREFEPLR